MDILKIQMQYEAEKRNGFAAAVLNLIIPGVGYAYCGNYLTGILSFIIWGVLMIMTLGFAHLFLAPLFVIDSFFWCNRHNRRLYKKLIQEIN